MKDVMNLALLWASFNKYVVQPSLVEIQVVEPELLLRMAYIAGAQSVTSCLESDRSEARFNRMLDEVTVMRMEVSATLEAARQAAREQPQ